MHKKVKRLPVHKKVKRLPKKQMTATQKKVRRYKAPEKRNEAIFKSVHPMIISRCDSFVKTTGHSFDDLYSEALFIFMRMLEKFDPDRGVKFSSVLYRALNNGLSDYIHRTDRPVPFKENRTGTMTDVFTAQDGEEHPHDLFRSTTKLTALDICGFHDKLNSLSPEAREVITVLFDHPEVIGFTGQEPPRIVRGMVQRYLSSKKKGHPGLSYQKSWAVIGELREVFSA